MGIFLDAIKDIFKKIRKLSRPYFTLEDNQIRFKIDSDTFYNFPVENLEIKTRHDSYIIDAYTINTNDIYVEYIHTDNDVVWTGLALPFFIDTLKANLKIRNMELLEKKEFDPYEFLTYKIDNEYILNIIHIYEVDKEIFIVDKKSNLYEDLIKMFEKNYIYPFEKNSKISLYMNFSLVKNNAIYGYFTMDSN